MRASALTLSLLACATAPGEKGWQPAAVEAPARCERVEDGVGLGRALASAKAICLAPGVYPGPLQLGEGVMLYGPPSAVIRSQGSGTTVSLLSGARLLGVTVDGSGGRFDLLDAAVHVEGDGGAVEGVTIKNAVFGILVEKARRVRIAGNQVHGIGGDALGLRGDGIRLWETQDSVVEDNQVDDSRDTVIWYSSGNRFAHNRVSGGRYGAHLMYSHRNALCDNVFDRNEVGVFLMYSRDVSLERNVMRGATGASGMGLGLKESGNVAAEHNQLVDNHLALYVDNAPLQPDEHNRFAHNLFARAQIAVQFHATPARNDFTANAFEDNAQQVEVEGGQDALALSWSGNHFDDYQGYDLDGDGVGDVPYELHSLSSDLVSKNPQLSFFRGLPLLWVVKAAGEVVPLLAPKTVLRDASPRIEVADAH